MVSVRQLGTFWQHPLEVRVAQRVQNLLQICLFKRFVVTYHMFFCFWIIILAYATLYRYLCGRPILHLLTSFSFDYPVLKAFLPAGLHAVQLCGYYFYSGSDFSVFLPAVAARIKVKFGPSLSGPSFSAPYFIPVR